MSNLPKRTQKNTHESLPTTLTKIRQNRNELFNLEVTEEHRNRWGDSWHRAGVLIVDEPGKFVLVDELNVLVDGKWIHNAKDRWNIPSGSCLKGESLINAAIREAREESAYDVELTGICLIKHGRHEDDPSLLVVFLAKIVSKGDPKLVDHAEIRACRAFSEEEIYDLARQGKLRSPNLVLGAIENYKNGLVAPLELLTEK